MISALLLSLAFGQLLPKDPPIRPRVFRSDGAGRISRLGSDDFAFFEAFPASGAGTSGACSTTPPTGAKGEALTFARASTATCTKTATGGLATTGIADGDLVVLSNNQPRVEYDSAGTLGLLVEASRTNSLPRFIDYANALWSDVGTPTLTGSQASPFAGTYATSAVRFDDNDAVAFEGRSQTVTVTAAAAYTAHCYVKAGTATSVRIVLDGTAATKTGLTSTWDIIEVTDASASGVAIVFEADVGSTAATTGTVTFGGCQVEAGTYRTSIIPTGASAQVRSAENPYFAITPSTQFASGCMSISQWRLGNADVDTGPIGLTDNPAGLSFRTMLTNFGTSPNNATLYVNASSTTLTATGSTGAGRWSARWGASSGVAWNGTLVSGGASSESAAISAITVGQYAAGGSRVASGLYGEVQVDPNPSRCSP